MANTGKRKFGMTNWNSKDDSLRVGKWSLDEETYANDIITSFFQADLVDCETGCSLREYLALKLNCSKMRISKKFQKRCIGKVIVLFLLNLTFLFYNVHCLCVYI